MKKMYEVEAIRDKVYKIKCRKSLNIRAK